MASLTLKRALVLGIFGLWGAWSAAGQSGPTPEGSELADAILVHLEAEEVRAFLQGEDPSRIFLRNGMTLEEFMRVHSRGLLSVEWFTLAAGGGRSAGGDFEISGTAGQWGTETLSSGALEMLGGFWALPTGPCDTSQAVFCNGFESGGTDGWSRSVGETVDGPASARLRALGDRDEE